MAQVIWTKHLRERIEQRGLNPSWVDTTVRFPDEVQRSSTTDSNKHIKVINGYQIVAAVKRQGSDWVITSAWWNPVERKNFSGYKQKDNRFFLEKWADQGLRALESLLRGKK
jgi:hypothetical protein